MIDQDRAVPTQYNLEKTLEKEIEIKDSFIWQTNRKHHLNLNASSQYLVYLQIVMK